MAKMSTKQVDGRSVVTIRGALQARDLRRLEHLCGSALEQKTPPLTLRVRPECSKDEAVRMYLDHLVRRGVVLVTE